MILINTGRARRMWSERRQDKGDSYRYGGMSAVGFRFDKQPRIQLRAQMYKGHMYLWYAPCQPFVRSVPIRIQKGKSALFRISSFEIGANP